MGVVDLFNRFNSFDWLKDLFYMFNTHCHCSFMKQVYVYTHFNKATCLDYYILARGKSTNVSDPILIGCDNKLGHVRKGFHVS